MKKKQSSFECINIDTSHYKSQNIFRIQLLFLSNSLSFSPSMFMVLLCMQCLQKNTKAHKEGKKREISNNSLKSQHFSPTQIFYIRKCLCMSLFSSTQTAIKFQLYEWLKLLLRKYPCLSLCVCMLEILNARL